MQQYFHSVTLNKDACVGCTNCVKRCPTEAIRVRDGKAIIIKERCIDCGECIRVCPHHAKDAYTDQLDQLKNYKYTVALPAPALYGQFCNMDDINRILAGLLGIGFDSVFEVAAAAEIVSDATRKMMKDGHLEFPVISSACPAVLRLIRVRFPELLMHVLPLNPPVEVAARLARERAIKATGLNPEDIGIVFITPCPAKMTSIKSPLGTDKSQIDLVISIRQIYPLMLKSMKEVPEDLAELVESGRMGIGWGQTGGESSATLYENYLAADGIENMIKVLEDLEDDKLQHVEFVELNACSSGCVGGVLTVENPYLAATRLKQLSKYRPVSCNRMKEEIRPEVLWNSPVDYQPIMQLSPNYREAIAMMRKVEEVEAELHHVDCGCCGAPSCRALAEDVVKGFANVDYCIYVLKAKLESAKLNGLLLSEIEETEKNILRY